MRRTIFFPAGEKSVFFVFGRTPTLSADAAPGAEVEFMVEVRNNDEPVWRDTFAIVVAGAPTAVADEAALPEEFTLGHSFPNPFNAATTIRYHLPHVASIDLSVFNATGQPVRRRDGWCCSNSLDSFDSTQSNAYPYWPLKSTTPHSTSRR